MPAPPSLMCITDGPEAVASPVAGSALCHAAHSRTTSGSRVATVCSPGGDRRPAASPATRSFFHRVACFSGVMSVSRSRLIIDATLFGRFSVSHLTRNICPNGHRQARRRMLVATIRMNGIAAAGPAGDNRRREVGGQSRRSTPRRESLTFTLPLYSMNPSFRNLFMKKFTRERVVPTISANVSCDTLGRTRRDASGSP